MQMRLLLPALLALSGCGGAGDGYDRQPVSGSITLGGEPLADGMITFAPTSVPEPAATAIVRGGSYSLKRSEGPAVGPHRVTIWARESTGRKVADPFDPEVVVEETVEVIPDRYNLSTELSAEVAPGPNSFDFELENGSLP